MSITTQATSPGLIYYSYPPRKTSYFLERVPMLTGNVSAFAIEYTSYPKILILILKPVIYNKILTLKFGWVLIIDLEVVILACYM